MYAGEKSLVILFMISRYFMNLFAIKVNEGRTFSELQKGLNLHPYALKKMLLQAKNFTVQQIKEILSLCQKLDLDLKRGRIEEKKGLEMLILKISRVMKN
jgi:DNA polymerase-3 subunit delta